MTESIFDYIKKVSRETDQHTLESLDLLDQYGRDISEYGGHLPRLRNKLDGDVAIPKARNSLARLIYECFTDDSSAKINPILSFLEMSTIASYVLDDIIDNQPERQKDVATWKKYGINKGIIAGGIQTFLAFRYLEKLDISLERKLRIYDLANNMWLKLWIGEGFNEEMKLPTTLEEYRNRCYNICGVMFDTGAQMAAISADISEPNIRTASEIGKNYGIAVMIRNDLVDLLPKFGKHSTALSKKPYEDVEKGICTYPIIHALQHCSEEEKGIIKDTLKRKTDENIEELQKILKRCNSIEATLELIDTYRLNTLTATSQLPETPSRRLLNELINLLGNLKGYTQRK